MQTPGMLLFTGAGKAVERATNYAKMAEERGFRNFLVTEAASDALALAQHVASVTSRIQVGTGIFNIFLHPAMQAALHALTIDTIAPGRLLLGLGTSHAMLNDAYGLPMDKPLTAMRQYIETMKSVFRGEHEGLNQLAAGGLAIPRAEHKIPIYVAGVSPKSLLLTGEMADGSIPAQFGPNMLKEVIDGVAEGAKQAGRSPQDVEIVPFVHCCVCEDRDVALRSVRQQLAFYGQMPFYNRIYARHGFEQEASQIMDAALKGDHAGATAAVSERLIEETAVVGTPQECIKQAEAFEKVGAAYVILYPMPIDGDMDRSMLAALEAFAQ